MKVRRVDLSLPIFIGIVVVLVVIIALPMGWLGVFAFSDKAGNATLANFVTLFSDPSFADPLVTTLIIAVSVSLICAAVAAPLAWLVARTDMPLARMVRTLIMASLVTPPFVGAVAWEMLAAPNSGLLNQFWRLVTGASSDEALLDIYTLEGLIFVIACYTFPYVFILLANALERMPGELEDASSMLGAGAWATARRITVPLALPTLLAGTLVAFLQALNLFGSPAILAIPAGFHTLTTKIWSLFEFPPKPELAAAAALPLLLLTVALLRTQALVLGRRGYAIVGGKYGPPRLIRLGAWRWAATAFAMLILSLPLFLPYLSLLNTAFSRVSSQIVGLDNFTLRNIRFTFWELSSTLPALRHTFFLAVSAATLGGLLALVIAYVVARRLIRGHRILAFLATAPLAIPGIVLGVGLFLAYTRPPLTLYGTLWILLIAFVTIELPAAYQQFSSAFHAVHPELEEAARMLGASRLRTLGDIVGPLLRSAAIATWCFIFVGVIRELSAAIILFTSETKVLSVLIFDLKESGDVGAIAVLSLTMVLITTVVIVAANRLVGRPAIGRLPTRIAG
ncbi:iron(III) transport system permease protein [Enhydrobacter aerosaccus]|uniref:Iron(III) transport system permease protein n=1 Tax=Enhydrobacter aerosaccus TaxID=225324 RepID=A0A1T4RKF6_9HYPH|nr:iron ABC transporter permease [Enhydrobacter aerosaccus]SKA16474.1 iron(III) transport system permease protein [Enhydrobacter aerosaccus]